MPETELVPSPPAPLVLPPTSAEDVRARIKAATDTLPAKVAAYTVTAATLEQAHAFAREIRAYRDDWAAFVDPHIEGAMEAKRVAEANRKRLVADKDLLDGPLARAEAALILKIDTVQQEAEKARLATIAALEAAAEIEAVADVEATIATLEEEAMTAPTRQEAQFLEAQVEEIRSMPVTPAVPYVPPVVPKGTGVNIGDQWSAELVSLPKLLKAMLEGKLAKPLQGELAVRIAEAIMPPLNKRARADMSALNIPGVKAVRKPKGNIR